MKKTIIATVLLALCASSQASSLSAQIGAVAAAEQSGKAQEQQQADAYQYQLDQQARRDQQQRAAASAAANKRAAAARAAAAAKAAKVEAERKAEVARDQGYEDKLRDIELRRQELALKAEEAKVNRSNEYIDQELRAKSAASDVVKSEADANRAQSQGVKTLLEKEGEARVKKESNWFN